MTTTVRIIPRLDIKGPNLVKGIHLEGLRVLGLPEVFAERYFRDGADELIFMDIVASLYGRNNLADIVQRTVENVFIPITVGGGIRSIDDVRRLLRAGADKVAINTAAVRTPRLITEAARIFGSQSIVLSIEAIRKAPGRYEAYTDNGREETGRDVIEWAREAVALGAGEILVTSVDREGTGHGYDVDLVRRLTDAVDVPVIACGGAGEPGHVVEVIRDGGADAVAAASIFHYSVLAETGVAKRAEGNVEYLKQYVASQGSILTHMKPSTVAALKTGLGAAGITCAASGDMRDAPAGDDAATIATGAGEERPLIVVVDYGRSNLFSVERALHRVGADVAISSDPAAIREAPGVVLAGVGAFGDGMKCLEDRGLVEPLVKRAVDGKPILGICLGMQLLMTESEEFGHHRGLGLIDGRVVRFSQLPRDAGGMKIPHIGWNEVRRSATAGTEADAGWAPGGLLHGLRGGETTYFVHSYIAIPTDARSVLAETRYGTETFCSVIGRGSVLGCQFHPERSGPVGLRILGNFVEAVRHGDRSARVSTPSPRHGGRDATAVITVRAIAPERRMHGADR